MLLTATDYLATLPPPSGIPGRRARTAIERDLARFERDSGKPLKATAELWPAVVDRVLCFTAADWSQVPSRGAELLPPLVPTVVSSPRRSQPEPPGTGEG